jgi:hypothetical protein
VTQTVIVVVHSIEPKRFVAESKKFWAILAMPLEGRNESANTGSRIRY